jgi:PKD repeat protein
LVNNLAVSFDSSGSGDPDGTIASYDWDFGDGAHSTQANPNHTYGSANTYTVTLTVTDDDGASDTVSHQVTTTAGNPLVLAADAFGRTVANGWGTADTGGAWTITGTASQFKTTGSTGQITTPAGATRTAVLGNVLATDSDSVVTVSLDKLPDVGSMYVNLGARQIGTSGYRAKLKVDPSGAITMTLVRTINNADTTLATTTFPAGTLTAGAKLQVRLQAQGTAPTTLRARAWLAGTTEPTTWQLTTTDSNAALQNPGGVLISSYLGSTTGNGPITATFDDLAVSAL